MTNITALDALASKLKRNVGQPQNNDLKLEADSLEVPGAMDAQTIEDLLEPVESTYSILVLEDQLVQIQRATAASERPKRKHK